MVIFVSVWIVHDGGGGGDSARNITTTSANRVVLQLLAFYSIYSIDSSSKSTYKGFKPTLSRNNINSEFFIHDLFAVFIAFRSGHNRPAFLPPSFLAYLRLTNKHSLGLFYLMYVGSNPHIWFLTLYCLSASCWAQQSTIFILMFVCIFGWRKYICIFYSFLFYSSLFYSILLIFPIFFIGALSCFHWHWPIPPFRCRLT